MTEGNSGPGVIALVGSGEYLPAMLDIERELFEAGVARGKDPVYVQVPLGAGRESADRINYWQQLGKQQADRLGVEQRFVPVLNRDHAEDQAFADALANAALIYFSGGDPRHLAESLGGTTVGAALRSAWESGSSVAGCSAGAMALGPTVPHVRGIPHHRTIGLSLVPHIEVLPHYDKYFRWASDGFMHALLGNDNGATILGIDENTALVHREGDDWQVLGHGKVHVLKGGPTASYPAGKYLTLPQPR